MGWTEQGRVQGGTIVFSKPLPLAEGTEVTVRIEAVVQEPGESRFAVNAAFGTLPFFGMWADRDDMADSAAWVGKERQRWQQRTSRQD